MEWFKGMLVYLFVGIMTGVTSLDVYLDTEKRKQDPGNTDMNCSLPNVPHGTMNLSHRHIETLVKPEERVWIGWQRNFTKWIDFRGCIKKKPFPSDIRNKSIDVSDPFLGCYRFCGNFSFMLSSKKCFCTNISPPPERRGFVRVNSSFVGNTVNAMCMYGPLTNYTHEFDERQDGNCLFAFKDNNNTLKFSNDLCKENKPSVCVTLSQKELFKINGKKNSTWLNNPGLCEEKGYISPSYSMISENRANATKIFTIAQQYWITAFRRPLYTCLAADLYTNGTLGKRNVMPCKTELRSLCIRSGVSVGSTGNVEPEETTGNVESGETTGNVKSGKTTGNVEPEETTGNVEPGGSTGKSDQIPDYVWGIVASVCVFCILIGILLFFYIRKVSESKNKTKRRSSPSDKAVSSTQTPGGVQPKRHDKSATNEETQDTEYHTVGASCHLSGSDDEMYHELHEKPRSQETHNCSNYDHVTHAMITENNDYDVFCKKDKSFNSDNVNSDYDTTCSIRQQIEGDYDTTCSIRQQIEGDYDTTCSIRQQIEGDYDTAGGRKIDQDPSEYDCIAGPSRANENSI